jgi:hypothetical protein
MKNVLRVLNIGSIVLLLSLALAGTAYAQDGGGSNVLAPFAPILAAAASIERLLQFIRNIVSPDPEKGPLARGTPTLRYYTTIGGVVLGLAIALISDFRALALAGIGMPPVLDTILTGVVVGLGTEFVHEVITILGEGKRAFRAASARGKE